MNELYKNFADIISDIFSNYSKPSKIAVAVSGGSDSMALAFLLLEFCRKNNVELTALTVDHGIRKNSFHEANEVNKIFAKCSVNHQILQIPREKVPLRNIEANLREIRYHLLEQYCFENKIEFLFLGHHIGDVAENFLIRLFRGSGLDGLSTISKIRIIESSNSSSSNLKIIRPLLDFSKQQLKDFLTTIDIKWFEDETNNDEKFLRNKIRKFLATFPDAELIEKRIKNASDDISKTRDLFDEIMVEKMKEISFLQSDGSYLINRVGFIKTDKQIALKILALILMKIGKKKYKPRKEKLIRFYNYLAESSEIKPRNFYGCSARKFNEDLVIIFSDITSS